MHCCGLSKALPAVRFWPLYQAPGLRPCAPNAISDLCPPPGRGFFFFYPSKSAAGQRTQKAPPSGESGAIGQVVGDYGFISHVSLGR